MSKFGTQLWAVFWRRFLIYKRSLISIIITLIIACIISCISVIISQISFAFMKNDSTIGFSMYSKHNLSVARITSPNCSNNCLPEISQYLVDTCKKEIGVDLRIMEFTSFDEFNNWTYNAISPERHGVNVAFSYSVEPETHLEWLDNGTVTGNIALKYQTNSTSYGNDPAYAILRRMLWKVMHKDPNADFTLVTTTIGNVSDDEITRLIGSFFVSTGLIVICSLFVGQIIDDVKTNRRSYMLSSGLSLPAYWLGCYLADVIICFACSLIIYFVNLAGKTQFISKYPGISFYVLLMSVLSMVLFTYVVSWIFTSKAIGMTFFLLFSVIPLLAFFLVDLLYGRDNIAFGIINGLLPFNSIYRIYNFMMKIISPYEDNQEAQKITLYYLFSNSYTQTMMILQIVDVFFYAALIYFIDWIRVYMSHVLAVYGWNGFENLFISEKAKQPMTEDAFQMEREVAEAAPGEFAIRIKDVSKLFHDTTGKPVCAVNQVSLGVRPGSLFGFLGANGAGKTTLLKMILKELAVSNGTIEIEGNDIMSGQYDATRIAVCPQFDDHMTPELTSREQIKFFALVNNIPRDEIEQKMDTLITTLGLEEHADKLMKELSGGNQRKVAVALAFLSDASIVLLDEPTSSLDPVARHKVHNLINMNRGTKTFMLCTHLLDEAETLCDNLSIMLNGCVYAVGTPQYLSNKFGSEWKVDLVLNDANEDTSAEVDRFFAQELPTSRISIKRPLSRIYSIPAGDIKLTELFRKMQNAKEANTGIRFYTCSCSTLEKVFLEIVMLSEQGRLREEEQQEEQQQNPYNSFPVENSPQEFVNP